jgi:hypothetical protein
MKTVYDRIRHRSTLEVICGNCDNSRVFNHRFLMSQFGGGQILAALKFVCRCGALRYPLRIAADSLGEPKSLRELVPMRWGLIPAWWPKSLKEIPATFNGRAESVADKPMFRDAFKGQCCIIPASGIYEWTGDNGNKQPHLLTAANGSHVLPSPASGIAGAVARPARISCRARGIPCLHSQPLLQTKAAKTLRSNISDF